MKMFSTINCFSSSINEMRSSLMNPRCKLISQLINKHIQSTESVVRTIPTVSIYHISEPIMSENSPKILSFRLVGEVFHSALREHCATVRHTARFWRLSHSVPCNFFIYFSPFLSVLFSFILIKVIFGAFLLKQLFYSGLNHTPISYISQTKQKKR